MAVRVPMDPEVVEGRRSGDLLLYTQADLDRLRERDRDDARFTTLAGQVGELRGTLGALPREMEATARRVFAEQMVELRKETSVARWRQSDTLIAAAQLLLAAAVVALALLK